MKRWYKSYFNAVRDAERENCEIVCGGNGWTDIYYLIPRDSPPGIQRVIARSQSDVGPNRVRVIYRDARGIISVIEETTIYRMSVVKRGLVPDEKVVDYLLGYYTRREESSREIKLRKEAARISHMLCELPGTSGHAERQRIRRELMPTLRRELAEREK